MLTGSAQQVVGAIDAAQTAGALWFGLQADQSVNWPETVVSSVAFNWTPSLGQMVESILGGTYGGTAFELSFANGGMTLVYGGVDVPPDVVQAADITIAAINAGDIEIARELPEE